MAENENKSDGFRVGILVFVLYKSCYSVMTNPCS